MLHFRNPEELIIMAPKHHLRNFLEIAGTNLESLFHGLQAINCDTLQRKQSCRLFQ